ncbi:glycosyltransferase family 69 protein [Amniculicola lignicola CBS 123094]|uniref:Glycosyltransferase family 69 protein n=1 Tax=Amniculicola lignicola CBS 123094 TaxID=1392246 RepID=A0A6A5W517_9PLEO|nr:glycosyltransferase family 69 protein [Amniculicola lignicola CBS 123094]
MFVPRVRRHVRRFQRGWFKIALLYLFVVLAWDTLRITSAASAIRIPLSQKPPPNERYFIASIHWMNAGIIKSHWKQAVLNLVDYLGADNCYVSVLEGGSWDNTQAELKALEVGLERLGVPNTITLEQATHLDEISRIPGPDEEGWIVAGDGTKKLRRIPYLARLRNRVMDDMRRVSQEGSRPFTKVLWLNDVVFTTEDIRTLLSTNGGNYAAACSLDFANPPIYYDTFALRDISGSKTATLTWPYFLSSTSRRALSNALPVPVKSCWNGAVAMDAAPFYDPITPLRFRGVEDSLAKQHLEGSECCLIHADNPLSEERGVYVNPNVRVGYNQTAYSLVNPLPTTSWFSPFRLVWGTWSNRLARWFGVITREGERSVVHRRIRKWQMEAEKGDKRREEKGEFCLVNEAQILVKNGWQHI